MTTDAVQKSYLSSTALSILYNNYLNRFIYTASELYLDANYLNARFLLFNLLSIHGTNEFSEKNDHSNHSNG